MSASRQGGLGRLRLVEGGLGGGNETGDVQGGTGTGLDDDVRFSSAYPGGPANADHSGAGRPESEASRAARLFFQRFRHIHHEPAMEYFREWRIPIPGGRPSSRASAGAAVPESVASRSRKGDMSSMESDRVTPRELAAEIKAVEERMDRRHAEMSGKIDLISERMAAAVERIAADVGRIERNVVAVNRDLQGNFDKLGAKIGETRNAVLDDNKSNRRLIVRSFVGIFVTTVVAGISVMLATNGLIMQAIDLGKSLPK